MWTTRSIDGVRDQRASNPDRIVLVASLVCLTCFLLSVVKDTALGDVQVDQTPMVETASAIGDWSRN